MSLFSRLQRRATEFAHTLTNIGGTAKRSRRSKRTVPQRRVLTFEPLEDRNLLAITISGVATYTTSQPGGANLTRPVRDASISLSAIINAPFPAEDQLVLETARTDDAGNYSFTIPDSVTGELENVAVTVRTIGPAPQGEVDAAFAVVHPHVLFNTLAGPAYWAREDLGDVANGTTKTVNIRVQTPFDADVNRAFEIFDAMVEGHRFYDALPDREPSSVSVVFPGPGSKFTDGWITDTVYVHPDDHGSWDVVLHEYGHYLAEINGFRPNVGGPHYFEEAARNRDSHKLDADDLDLAWNEGWATFFSIWAQNAQNAGPTFNIQEVGDDAYENFANIESTSGFGGNEGFGEDNELAVARILWDLADGGATGIGADENGTTPIVDHDRISWGFDGPGGVWKYITTNDIENLAELYSTTMADQNLSKQDKIDVAALFSSHNVSPYAERSGPSPGQDSLSFEFTVPRTVDAYKVQQGSTTVVKTRPAGIALNAFKVLVLDAANNYEEIWASPEVTISLDTEQAASPFFAFNRTKGEAKYTPPPGEAANFLTNAGDKVWLVEGRYSEPGGYQGQRYWSDIVDDIGTDLKITDFQYDAVIDRFVVTYDVLGNAVGQSFDIDILAEFPASAGGGDQVLQTETVSQAADLTPGSHQIEIAPGYADPGVPHTPAAALDSGGVINEMNEKNNRMKLANPGIVIFQNSNNEVIVLGTDGMDNIDFRQIEDGSITFGLPAVPTHVFQDVSSIHIYTGDLRDTVHYGGELSSETEPVPVTIDLGDGDDSFSRFSDGPSFDPVYFAPFTIYAGPGNDQLLNLRANTAAMVAYGGPGNDWIIGTAGDDILYGGPGVDRIQGETGNDTLYDNDEYTADEYADTLDGEGFSFGPGDDTLYGSALDTLDGGGGNDTINTLTEGDTIPPLVGVNSPGLILTTTIDIDFGFSEEVTGFTPSDVILSSAAAEGANVSSVTPQGSDIWQVTITDLTEGTLGIAFGTNPGDVTDMAGNSLSPVSYLFSADPVAPTLVSASPYEDQLIGGGTGSQLAFVTFSEAVNNFDATDITLGGAGGAGAIAGTPTIFSGNTWQFLVSGLSDGPVDVTLGGNIEDTAGNPFTSTAFSFNSDQTAPTVTGHTPVSLATVDTTVTEISFIFDEEMTNIDADDLVLSGASGALVGNPAELDGNTWVFPVIGLTTSSVTATLDGDVSDLAGNDLAAAVIDFSVDVDTPHVVAVSPLAETIGGTATFIDVTFSKDVTGVDVTDLELDGTGGAGAIVADVTSEGNNIWRFLVLGLVTGTVDAALARDPDDIEDSAGTDVPFYEWSFDVEADSPTIEAVIVRNTTGVHDDYAVPDKTVSPSLVDEDGDQLVTIPVGGGINQIDVVFSEHVLIDEASALLVGGGGFGTAYTPTPGVFDYDEVTFTATWTYDHIKLDQLMLTIFADTGSYVTDQFGNRLDGEWVNPASTDDMNPLISTFSSGEGNPGGDFAFAMTVLLGDANLDNVVGPQDYTLWANYYGIGGRTFQQGDWNGDGDSLSNDYTLWANHFGVDYNTWPTGAQQAMSGGGMGPQAAMQWLFAYYSLQGSLSASSLPGTSSSSGTSLLWRQHATNIFGWDAEELNKQGLEGYLDALAGLAMGS